MTDAGPNLEAREFSVRTPGRIEHIGVRRRDWDEIKDGIGNCQKSNGWLSNCSWTLVGGTIGGAFGVLALKTATAVSPLIWVSMSGATFVMAALAVIVFVLDRQLGKGVEDSVSKLRKKMDSIVQESDREDAI